MDVHVSSIDRIPVLTLHGRFDGFGALQFDEAVQALDASSAFWVIECAGVAYISSIGLRSLVALEKSLRARDGGLVLVALTRPVQQVLELTKLEAWFRSTPNVDAAMALVRAGSHGPVVEQTISGRRLAVCRMAGGASCLEWWGAAAGGPLTTVGLGDLGFAFGVGGFGERVDGQAGVGAFVCTPWFAGVLPAEAHGVSDFMTGGASAAMPIQIASALGVAGTPAFAIEITAEEPFMLLEAVRDVCDLAAADLGARRPSMGIVAVGERRGGGGLLAVAVVRESAGEPGLPASGDHIPIGSGRTITGGAVSVVATASIRASFDLQDALRSVAHADALSGVVGIDAPILLARATIWVFLPDAIRGGAEKLLRMTVEGDLALQPTWDAIVRRLYADCQSVTLTPLHGGFNSKTFRVSAYDRDGRRMLPTVLKIGPAAITAREEQANRDYVARFVLNNGTTVLGGAREGEWSGLRYNFLGVNGPESRVVWLRDHYLHRPTEEVVPLFETLLTRALKPWYAQPKWEQVWLYRDHTPLRLFPNLLEVAERDLSISCDAPLFDCPELGLQLPNPFHFLKHEYPRRAKDSRLWYTTVCHGDLNLQNVLVDERENVYVIDFSETRPRNAVSDFARIEPILKFELTRLESDDDLRQLLEFEVGLTSVTLLGDPPPFTYRGDDPLVARAHTIIALLRRYADVVTLFETDMLPYWLALLEWTYSVVCYAQESPRQKRYAACSAALICRAIQELESGA